MSESKPFVDLMFSKPIYGKTVNIDTKKIVSMLNESDFITAGSITDSNASSISNSLYVLDEERFKFLKDELMKEFYLFINEIMHYSNKFEITTSWFTKTIKNESSAFHNHNNCMLSGILYLQTDENTGKIGFQNFNDYRTGELYHGPGESFVPFDQCPVGFEVCPKSGKCVQKCMNCKLNVDNKSQEFNEADPCFPEGVYAGIDNLGNTRCTCGQNGQYCSDSYIQKKMNDIFTADGTMILSDSNVGAIVIGDYTDVMSFAAIED